MSAVSIREHARRFRGAEVAVLVALALWSLIPLATLLHYVSGTLLGVDGPIAADQLQYLAWARSAGSHVLIANDYDLLPPTYVFLHPLFLAVGALWRLGVSLPVAYLLFKPIAVGALFAGFLAYVNRLLAGESRARRIAALAIALGAYAPIAAAAQWAGAGSAATRTDLALVATEATSASHLWGYLPTAIALGLMPVFLLCVEALLDGDRRSRRRGAGWYAAWAAVAGLLVSWLHPWQGVTLLVILAATLVWTRAWRRMPALIGPAVATAAPILYYFLLAHYDDAWHVAAQTNRLPHTSLLVLLAAFGPLAVGAAAGATGRPANVQERMLRLWPLAGLAVYFATPSVPAHALEGVTLPLAVLAVRGWARVRAPAFVGAAVVAVLIVPGTAVQIRDLRRAVLRGNQPFALPAGEDDALRYLGSHHAPSGGVLAPVFLADAIPERTGRRVWVGHSTWSTDFLRRATAVELLFAGRLPPGQARQLVRSTGARLLVSDCHGRPDLAPVLGPLLASVKRFGCASVYELRPGAV